MTVSVLEISNRIDYTPTVAVAEGAFVLFGGSLGLATRAIVANKKGSLLDLGVVSAPIKTGDTFTAGKRCYFDTSTQKVVSSATKTYAGLYVGVDPENSLNAVFKLNAVASKVAVKDIADLADLSYIPDKMIKKTAGENLAYGEISYLKAADSKNWLAKANAAATSVKVDLVIAIAAVEADAVGEFMEEGLIRADTLFGGSLTVGAPVYVSAATGGKLTQTAPTGGGTSWVRQVGIALSATVIKFKPSDYYVAN